MEGAKDPRQPDPRPESTAGTESRRKNYPSDVYHEISRIRKNLNRNHYGNFTDYAVGMLNRELVAIEMAMETMVDDHPEAFMKIEIERQSDIPKPVDPVPPMAFTSWAELTPDEKHRYFARYGVRKDDVDQILEEETPDAGCDATDKEIPEDDVNPGSEG